MRASYQDSNIFTTDRVTTKTVQKTAGSEVKEIAVRKTNTFNSGVFEETDPNHLRYRDQNTFNSQVFGGPKQNKCNRVKLEPAAAGTEKLFGVDKVEYDKTSTNVLLDHHTASAQKNKPVVRDHIPAHEKVKQEYFGQTSHGLQKQTKRDGALMAQGVDWKNANERAIETKDA